MARFFLLVIGLLLAVGLQAGSLVEPESGHYFGQPLEQPLDYLQDPEGQLTLDDVRHLPAERWEKQRPQTLGFNPAAHWYRLTLKGSPDEPQPWFLVAPFTLLDQVSVYWIQPDGKVLAQHSGDHQPLQARPDWSKRFAFPFQLQPEQPLQAYVRIQTQGLANTQLLLWQADDFKRFGQQEGRLLSFHYGIIGGLGIFFLFIFIALRDPIFLYFGGLALMTLLMSMTNAGEFSVHPLTSQWPGFNNYLVIVFPLLSTAASLMFLAVFFNLKKTGPRLIKVFYLYVLIMLLAASVTLQDYTRGYQLTLMLAWISTPLILVVIVMAWRQGIRPAILILIGMICTMLGVGVDISRALTDSMQPFLLGEYGFMGRFMARHGVLLGMSAQTAFFALAVAQKIFLERKEREVVLEQLVAAEEKQRALIETNARQREQLMREMHDGLGSQLTTTLYAARREDTPREELATHLQETLQDLRLMMDSLQVFDGDVATLLGQLRYRMERRLQAAGLELVWQVDDLPDFPEMTPQDALNLQRIVQEALTNVIKHAQASRVTLSTQLVNNQALKICICDNGRGFNPEEASQGRGLDNLFHRASELGSQLKITTQPKGQGCQLELTLQPRK